MRAPVDRPNPRVPRIAAALIILCVFAAPARAASEPPVWPQFQGNAAHTGVGSGPTPPYRVGWTFHVAPSGQEGLSPPIIAGNVVVAVGPKAVYGVDLATGAQLWTVPRDGPPSAPAIADTKDGLAVVYIDGRTDSVASLKAISLETQKPVWEAPVSLDSVSRSGVTIDGGTAFVGDAKGTIYAVDVATGSKRWDVTLAGEQKGPLAAADGKVYVIPQPHESSDRVALSVVALQEATGQQAWTYTPPVTLYTASLGAVSDGTVDVVLADARLVGIAAATGAEQWSVSLTQPTFPFSSPAVDGGNVYVADHQGDLQSVRTSTGAIDWLYAMNERIVRSSPVVVGDRVLLGLGDGSLGVVDRTSGHLVWRSRSTAGQIGGIAVASSAIVAEKGGANGGLVAFETDPNGSLLDLESPTVPHYGAIAARFAIAFAVVGAISLGIFTPIARRLGPADFSVADEGDFDDGSHEDEA